MFIDQVGYGKDFVIYDSDDCLRVVKEIMKSQNFDDKEFNPRSIQGLISQTKGKALTPSEYSATVDSYLGSVVLEVYKAYAGKPMKDNALDFDDLLLLFRQILEVPEVREYFHGRFQYFMVDEYQDTNGGQYQLLKLLTGVRSRFTAVGDDDQAIYGWRGADIGNLKRLPAEFPALKVIKLEQNYRSTARILKAANSVIPHNEKLFDKRLWCELGHGDQITVTACKDNEAETEGVAR